MSRKRILNPGTLLALFVLASPGAQAQRATWTADNGNGTFRTKLEVTPPGLEQSFQWIETPTGELVLMSLSSNRYLRIDPKTQAILCDSAGPTPDGKDGARLVWALAAK